MRDFKTVEGSAMISDPLLAKQQEDVARMRTSLLACSGDLKLAGTAMQNIAVLRLYHQMSRVIRYLDLMDKLEDKLYESIDNILDFADTSDKTTLILLLKLQGQLQDNMVTSYKLLQPFVDQAKLMAEMSAFQLNSSDVSPSGVLSSTSRESIRAAAQTVLSILPIDELAVNDV